MKFTSFLLILLLGKIKKKKIKIHKPKTESWLKRKREFSKFLYFLRIVFHYKMFFSPANSYNFHEASRWKAQSSRRIGNFARHLLMHECVSSSDERSKNEIEYYANAKWLCKAPLLRNVACDIGTRVTLEH